MKLYRFVTIFQLISSLQILTQPPIFVSIETGAVTSPKFSLPLMQSPISAWKGTLYWSTLAFISELPDHDTSFDIDVPTIISLILCKCSCFSEKVIVSRTKQNITFQGQGFTSTAIAWNDTAKSANGTFYSGSVQVFANNFIAKNISFMVRVSVITLYSLYIWLLVLICFMLYYRIWRLFQIQEM